MGIQHLVDFLPVLLKYQSVFLSIYIFGQIGKIGKQSGSVLVLLSGGNIGADLLYFSQQIVTFLF